MLKELLEDSPAWALLGKRSDWIVFETGLIQSGWAVTEKNHPPSVFSCLTSPLSVTCSFLLLVSAHVLWWLCH